LQKLLTEGKCKQHRYGQIEQEKSWLIKARTQPNARYPSANGERKNKKNNK
jgi:hypothetical protein